MATTKKSKKFDKSLSIEEKLDQVLMGLDYKFGVQLQARLTEVFNSNEQQFKSFIDYLNSPEGEKHLYTSEYVAANILIELFGRCKGQFENDWNNGSYEFIEQTASYVFDPDYELFSWDWDKFNDLQ